MKLFLHYTVLLLTFSSSFGEEFGPQDDPKNWKLSVAIHNDDIELVKKLVEEGASVSKEPTTRNGHRHGHPPICAAAASGRTAIANFLLSKGADPNSTVSSGESALWLAADGGYLDMVRLLLNSGAAVNGSPVLMSTPVDATSGRIKHFENIRRILIENGGESYRESKTTEGNRTAEQE
jgi:ankyrin repeat protein